MIPRGFILGLDCSGTSPKVVFFKEALGSYLEKYHYRWHYWYGLQTTGHKIGIKKYTKRNYSSILMVQQLLERERKILVISDLDTPVCNQDHKTATVIKLALAGEERALGLWGSSVQKKVVSTPSQDVGELGVIASSV